MRVLVVGGTGFLGRPVAELLTARGHRVTVLARTPRPGTALRTGDATRLTEDDWAELLADQDGVVFAAGVDDRTVPPAPAAQHFHAGNVEPVRRLLIGARRAGVGRAVLHGSYFSALHRAHPELRLTRRHPYVASRVAQAVAARRAADGALPVAVLEIPFVFGATPGRRPLWAPLVPWLRAGLPLAVPVGGTAVVTVDTVAASTVEALEQGREADLPIADDNLSWRALLTRFAAAAGRRTPPPLLPLPTGALHALLGGAGLAHRLRGREPGLATAHLADLLTRELYLPRTGDGDLSAALRATVRASRRS
ncbi:NAD-dependent epimerase/dehydratase family protein [Kitasatospora sp. LaBMicrA B282]|uniref:NAD-dependent epimerase/dehydratase family protein n=1 Tax=Kitasatospora sp. LaBMicrA B282 TaxID=3420949 RepID=UPI003D14FB68